MRKLIFLLCLCASLCSFSQNDKIMVTAQMQAQESSWNNGDLIGFMDYYWKSDSLKFIGKKGITYGWQQTLDNYIKAYPDKTAMGILKFEIKECLSFRQQVFMSLAAGTLKKKNRPEAILLCFGRR